MMLLNHMKGIVLAGIGLASPILYSDSIRRSIEAGGIPIQHVKREVIKSNRSTTLEAYTYTE
jgi:hypothetical protein